MGSSRIYNFKPDKSVASLVLKFEYRQEIKSCNVDKLKKLFDASNISERPTHIVQSVEYGWEAFFVFEKTAQNGTSLKLAQKKLEMIASKLTHSKIFNAEDYNQNFCDGVTCKVFADSEIDSPPSTFFEALETIQQLWNNPFHSGIASLPCIKFRTYSKPIVRDFSWYVSDISLVLRLTSISSNKEHQCFDSFY